MDWKQKQVKAAASAALARLGLSIEADFVPWSKSRHATLAGKQPPLNALNLNWRVTVKKGEQVVLSTDYSVGIAHCPSYKLRRYSTDEYTALLFECEHGKAGTMRSWGGITAGAPILPDPLDVFFCLVSDSTAIDHPSYESWASDLGYDPDSRKGEAAYRECLAHGLALRAAVGDTGLAELKAAFRDF
jgi:hypothetical protein